MTMNRSPALIIAIVLLLLPVAYVGSYLVLVEPGPEVTAFRSPGRDWQLTRYRFRLSGATAEWFYWPLAQIDRMLRPQAWQDLSKGGVI